MLCQPKRKPQAFITTIWDKASRKKLKIKQLFSHTIPDIVDKMYISYCSPTSAVIQKGLHLVRKRSHQGMQVLTSHGIECIIESVKAAVLLGPAIAGADRDDPTCACDGI